MALSKSATELEKEFTEYEERRRVRQSDAWMPEVGARMKGEVVGLRTGGSLPEMGGYGYYPVIVYRDFADNSTKAVHAFHTTLREHYKEMADGEPTKLLGQVHFISYQGKKTSSKRVDSEGKPQTYHLYDVETVGKETAAVAEDFAF